jgi:hypothetical protein
MEADTSWDHQPERSFDSHPVQPDDSPVASSEAGRSGNVWTDTFASQTTASDSPFQQSAGFAEWRSLPSDQHGAAEVHSATFDGGEVPVIRPSNQGTHRDQIEGQEMETIPPAAPTTDDIQPPSYGPRFSDPVTSTGDRQDQVVQPVSLSVELNAPIATADAGNSGHRDSHILPWPAAGSYNAHAASAMPEPGESQIGMVTPSRLQQPSGSLQGPGFGSSVSETGSTSTNLSVDELDELALTAESQPSQGIAGKPLAFWAMIGGLVLLLGCALLRRPTESRDSFH